MLDILLCRGVVWSTWLAITHKSSVGVKLLPGHVCSSPVDVLFHHSNLAAEVYWVPDVFQTLLCAIILIHSLNS